jgi:transcriptional repressor NrdR
MHCPFCQHENTRVIDSRLADEGSTIRRRRECEACGERFSTFETAEIKLPSIVKSDGRREAFDERKLRTSFDRALQKRPVPAEKIEHAVRAVIRALRLAGERELPSLRVGECVMAELKKLDQVAYVRYASVYRSFEDVQAFREEIERLERDLPVIEGLQLPLLTEPPDVPLRKR